MKSGPYARAITIPPGNSVFIRRFAYFLISGSLVTLFGGCLSQDFERESLAKYKSRHASTFVNFEPLPVKKTGSKPARPSGQRLSFPSGRFTGPGGGRFSGPAGRMSWPMGNRFSSPGNFSYPRNFRGQGRFTWPSGQLTQPGGRLNGAGRWTGPESGRAAGSRFTWPRQSGTQRFTSPRGFPGNGFSQPARD